MGVSLPALTKQKLFFEVIERALRSDLPQFEIT